MKKTSAFILCLILFLSAACTIFAVDCAAASGQTKEDGLSLTAGETEEFDPVIKETNGAATASESVFYEKDESTSGECGADITWELTGEEPELVLTLRGTGKMNDFTDSTIPWAAKQSVIQSVLYFVLLKRLQDFLKGVALGVNVQVDRL